MNRQSDLEKCFNTVLSVYGIHTNLHHLASEIIKPEQTLKPEDLVAAGKKIGAEISLVKEDLDAIGRVATPCILLLKDNRCAVFIPQGKGAGKLWSPDPSCPQDATLKHVQQDYTGRALTFSLSPGKAGAKKAGPQVEWFWAPIESYLVQYGEVLLATLFVNIFAMAMPVFSMNVYDRVVPNFSEPTLYALVIGISLVLVFDFIIKTIRSYVLENVAAMVGAHHDVILLEQMIHIRPTAESLSVGEKVNIFRELQETKDYYAARLAPAFVDLPFFALFVFAIWMISPEISLVTLIGTGLIVLCNVMVQIPIARRTHKYIADQQAKSSHLVGLLQAIPTIHMFGIGGSQLFRWQMTTEHASQSSAKNTFLVTLATNLSYMIMYLVTVVSITVGVYQIHDGALSVGGLVATSLLSSRAIALVLNFASVVSRMKQSANILQMVDKIFQLPGELDDARASGPAGRMDGNIEVRNVTFAYPGQSAPALADVSLSLKKGDHVGLIGQSGAGKSTLAQLLAGYLITGAGVVTIDGLDTKTLHPDAVRSSVGIIPQNPYFFSGSVLDNIVLGDPSLTPDVLEKTPLVRDLLSFIRASGLGADTPAGEGGSKLSGGQRQAIALARVLVRDPSILIFDEPTTGMDFELEKTVREGLADYIRNRTFVMVTHRTGLLSLVERIVYLNQGRIVADGPRDEIMRKLSGAVGNG